jgi:translation initiation factor 5B
LRERGGSIADLAVVVIDVLQGIQPQTVEAIDILRSFKTPFVVAANKIDLMHGWASREGEFSQSLAEQSEPAKTALDEKVYSIVGRLFELGFESERFDRCSDFTKQVPIVPLSAKTGEGLPELLMLLGGLSQRFLRDRLEVSEDAPAKGTIIEVKEERGLGKTIDVILYDGMIRAGQEIVFGSSRGVMQTKVRALLKPKPLREIRESGDKFVAVGEAHAACGVKIAAPNLESALAGAPIAVVKTGGEKHMIERELASIRIQTESVGAVLRADTLGALEALTVLLKKEGLPVKKADIGEITKGDVMEAISVKAKEPLKAVVFGFNVRAEEAALEEAARHNVKIFSGNVVYRLLEDYSGWVAEQKEREKKEKLARLTMPSRVRFLPGFVFRQSKPAVIGVRVLEGRLRAGTRLMSESGKIVGRIEGIQSRNEAVEQASKGQEVALSIDKGVVGRNLKENEVLFSFIPENQLGELAEMDALTSDEKELLDEIKRIVERKREAEE